ncbi:MAG: hypothetical protein ACLFUM_11580 [Spirochaetaceae bacterium]
MKKLHRSLAALLAPAFMAGCNAFTVDEPPFRYREVAVIRRQADEGSEPEADASTDARPQTGSEELLLAVTLENVSDRGIESFEATVYFYQRPAHAGKPRPVPATWQNDVAIPAGERRRLRTDLSDTLHFDSSSLPSVDMIHIRKARLSGGAVWRDPLAAYAWMRGDNDGEAVDE